jgi:hypothetical protein
MLSGVCRALVLVLMGSAPLLLLLLLPPPPRRPLLPMPCLRLHYWILSLLLLYGLMKIRTTPVCCPKEEAQQALVKRGRKMPTCPLVPRRRFRRAWWIM